MKLLADLQSYVEHLYNNFHGILGEIKSSRENPYEIADWIKKENREKDILVYRITATDKYISNFSILEIYNDNSILYQFSKSEIKYISTLAIFLHYKKEPRYQVIWEEFRNNLDQNILSLQEKEKPGIIKTNIAELENHFSMIDGLSGRDAYNLGKISGIRERHLEEKQIYGLKRSS